MTDPDHIENMRYLSQLIDLWEHRPLKQYGEDDRTYREEEDENAAKLEDSGSII
jgi:hypothetical protein